MQRTVTVTGRGSVPAVPDSALVRVAATASASSLAEAVDEVGRVSGTLARVARSLVDQRHVASTGVQVWARYGAEGEADGFEASHQMAVRCPDLEVASRMVQALAGEVGDALRVDAVQLRLGDPSSAHAAAREAAWVDARVRALHLADLAGAGLGDVLAVEEGGAGGPGGGPVATLAAQVVLEPGEQAVEAAVTVTWQLV